MNVPAHVTQARRAADDGYRRIRWGGLRPGDIVRSRRHMPDMTVLALEVSGDRALVTVLDSDGCERSIDARHRGRCDLRISA